MAIPVYDHDRVLADVEQSLRQVLLFASRIDDDTLARAQAVLALVSAVEGAMDPLSRRVYPYSNLARQQRLVDLFQRTKQELLTLLPADAAVLTEMQVAASDARRI